LPPLYYLHNFRLALEHLEARYAGLLSEVEATFMQQFVKLPEPSQCLLVRLLMRKGPEFRRSTLQYAEVPDPGRAIDELAALGWVDPEPALSVDDLLRVLDRREQRDTIGTARRRRMLHGPDGIDPQLLLPLAEPAPVTRPLSQWNRRITDGVIRLTVAGLARRLQLLFFGNDHQSWAQFVLSDLGVLRYEQVPFDTTSRAFRSREEIEDFYRLSECRARLGAGEPALAVREDLRHPAAVSDWLEQRFIGLQLRVGEMLERDGAADLALHTYRGCGTADGLIKAVRLQERMGLHAQARNDALAVGSSPCTEAQREAAARALARLDRRLGAPPTERSARARVEMMEIAIARPSGNERVEFRVAAHLGKTDSPTFYVENCLLTSLFGLLCWEAVFAPLPGAFFHPFQTGPADLYTPQFRARRASRFDALLDLLDRGEHATVIRRNYRAKAGICSPFVRWGRLRPQLLDLALECIPAAHLRLWFDRLLENPRENSTGMPDLIQFWPAEGRYRLVEVKAPGDRLQHNQHRWMTFFARHLMPAALCKVTWTQQAVL
jgi:hypothetical protein